MRHAKLLALVPALLLVGCATTFTLGHVAPAAGHTVAEEQLAVLVCKDQAHDKAGAAGPQTTEFLLGLTLVGAPAGRGMDREIQRKEFTSCMAAKGFTVS